MKENELTTETAPSRMSAPQQRTGSNPPRIVIAEDDEEMALLLVRAFEKAGYGVKACRTGWDLLQALGLFPASGGEKSTSLVVSDLRLPGISGLDVLKACGYSGDAPPVILITAFGDNWTHQEAIRLGAVDMLDKPFDIDELVDRVRELIPPTL